MGENDTLDNTDKKRILIVGAGLVGSLQALYFAQRSYKVDIFERRPDPRETNYYAGRSINLALSERGRAALRLVGAEDHVVKTGIQMHSRMLHSHDGKRTPMPYGKKDQYILSIDRRLLNEHLIGLVDSDPNIKFNFNDKFIGGDLKSGSLTFENVQGKHEEKGHLILGCDGSFSNIRKELMKITRMNFNQEYIPHGYKEIQMPCTSDGDFSMEVNYLHIWPRNTFMMIALPNQDKTFTLTLFMPYWIFDEIKTDSDILDFFEREFPDSIPLIGKEKLINEYRTNPVGDLVSIKCSPYHYKDKVVIMGDAAHAMVPFYGQGMNCGFEDCLVFHSILDKHPNNVEEALTEYSKTRNPDAEAIIDLAMYNYIEMRSHVNSPLFALRKKLDGLLNMLFPNYWIPLYTMTTFTRIPYHEVIEKSKRQDEIVKRVFTIIAVVSITTGGLMVYRLTKEQSISSIMELVMHGYTSLSSMILKLKM